MGVLITHLIEIFFSKNLFTFIQESHHGSKVYLVKGCVCEGLYVHIHKQTYIWQYREL